MTTKIAWTILVISALARPVAAEDQLTEQHAKGIVFHDVNGDRRFNDGDQPLAGVKVSNGREIVETDAAGLYRIPVDDDTTLFVIKPSQWRTPLNDHKLPQFYYIHKPHGSPTLIYQGVKPTGPLPTSIDFPLYPQKEPDQFRAILFGDPQPRDQKEIDYIAHDVVEELMGAEASFGVTLGDIMFDDLSLFKSLNATIALIGIPWYNVIGNHDLNFDARDDKHSDETFESVYGPPYYSFDYGAVHFLVLDDVDWHIPQPGGEATYRAGLGEEQLEFIRNDLAQIPADQLVVLMMHIPINEIHDRPQLFRMIEKRRFCISISGHTHYHQHRFIKKSDGWLGPEPHHHIVNVTVCGSWWSGKPDERGIPHTMMRDGAPNGYSIISFDGTKYRLDFKAAGKPADYQMRIMAPEVVKISGAGTTTVYANVFNGSERTEVEMRIGNEADWIEMSRTVQRDPGFTALVESEKRTPNLTWRALPAPELSSHLWKAELIGPRHPGAHMIHVRATLADGRTYEGRRVVRVIE